MIIYADSAVEQFEHIEMICGEQGIAIKAHHVFRDADEILHELEFTDGARAEICLARGGGIKWVEDRGGRVKYVDGCSIEILSIAPPRRYPIFDDPSMS